MEFFQNEIIQVRITHTPKLIPSDGGYLRVNKQTNYGRKTGLWNDFLFSLCSSCHDIQFLSSSPCFPGAERILQLIGPVWERQITINSGSSGVSRGAALSLFLLRTQGQVIQNRFTMIVHFLTDATDKDNSQKWDVLRNVSAFDKYLGFVVFFFFKEISIF